MGQETIALSNERGRRTSGPVNPENLILLCTARGCTHRILTGQSHGVPDYTFADAGYAMANLQQRYADAFMFRVAGDDSVRSRLWAAVFQEAIRLKEQESWPETINGNRYLEPLTQMLLDEERWRASQRNNHVRGAVMDVSQRTWYRRLNKPYAQLQSETMESWCGTAWRHIRRRINS